MKKFEDYTIQELQDRIKVLEENEELKRWTEAKKLVVEMEDLLNKIRDLGFDISVSYFREISVDILGFEVDDEYKTIDVDFR